MAARRSLRLERAEAKFFDRCKGLVFSLVLHGHTSDGRKTSLYSSKFLQNIRKLVEMYPGCLIVLYFDQSTPLAFLQAVHAMPQVHLVFFRQKVPSKAILYARLLELDRRPGCLVDLQRREGRKWVFVLNGHKELETLDELNPTHARYHAMVKRCITSDHDSFHGAVLVWNEMDVNPPRPPRLFPRRVPSIVIDGGAVGIPVDAYVHRPPIEPLIRSYYENFAFAYSTDELLLDEWFVACFGPKWWESNDLYMNDGDAESHLSIGDLEIVPPFPVGEKATEFAHEVIDWSSVPGSEMHPKTKCWHEKKTADYNVVE